MTKNLLLSTLLAAGFSIAGGTGAFAGVAPIFLPGFCVGDCLNNPTAATKDPMLLKFDENGHASIAVNGGAFTPLTGTLGADPSVPASPGNLPVEIYNLPQQVISGDVRILDPGPGISQLSDVLRFTTLSGDGKGVINGSITGAGRTVMIYYSDQTGAPDDNALADTGFPANLGTGLATSILEVGPEGNNGFDYLPGGVHYPANNEYIGISDSTVPEMSTWAMMIVGFLGLSFAGYRKAKTSKAAFG
jgi:hypothetical protein